jgi:hypothetical protein
MSGMRNVKIAVPVALAIVVAGIVGLKSHNAKRGEEVIRNWLFDHDMQDQVSWRSISASPLGSSYTLHDVELADAGVTIGELEVSNLYDQRDRSSADIRFSEVVSRVDEERQTGFIYRSGIAELLSGSGLHELKPFDGRLHWDYQRESQTAVADLEADLPDMLSVKMSLGLNQAEDFVDAFSDAPHKGSFLSSPSGVMFALLTLLSDKGASRVELSHLNLELKDSGYFKRSAMLTKRYNFVPDPQSSDWEADREAAFKKSMEEQVRTCQKEFRDAGSQAREGCDAYIGLLTAQNKGLSVSLEPKERVRLTEVIQGLDHNKRLGRLAERTNFKIDTL